MMSDQKNRTSLFFYLLSLFFILLVFVLLGPNAAAAPIPGLYYTGVDNTGTVLPVGTSEQHYEMTGPSYPATVITASPYWIKPSAGSSWIGPSNGNVNDPLGDYSYVLTFDLTGLDPATAVISGGWATDNTAKILLNGIDTGISKPLYGFTSLDSFTISSGFVPGTNTLEFVVSNRPEGAGSINPTGLLVANLSGEASEGCKSLQLNHGIFGEMLVFLDDQNCYDFTLTEASTMAIISSGTLDLQGELFEVIDGNPVPVDADNDGVAD